MNNRGWGLKEMLILSTILIAALFISYFIFKDSFNNLLSSDNSIATYKEYEVFLADAAKEYVKDKDLEFEDYLVVTSNRLNSEDYLVILDDPKGINNCTGYVVVKGSNYLPYLSCTNNYETSGYTDTFKQ